MTLLWVSISIILAINSMWLLKLNKDLIERNEYLIRQMKTEGLKNAPFSDEKIEVLEKIWLNEIIKKHKDNEEDEL